MAVTIHKHLVLRKISEQKEMDLLWMISHQIAGYIENSENLTRDDRERQILYNNVTFSEDIGPFPQGTLFTEVTIEISKDGGFLRIEGVNPQINGIMFYPEDVEPYLDDSANGVIIYDLTWYFNFDLEIRVNPSKTKLY